MRGFEEELELAGVSADRVLRHGQAPVSYSHGAMAMSELLRLAPDVEAVFAVSDLSAVGVVMECQRRGIRIPEDISVIGFGDFEIGKELNPALTTIHVDFSALGRRTGQMILDLLTNGERDTTHIVDVGLRIVERDSVGRWS